MQRNIWIAIAIAALAAAGFLGYRTYTLSRRPPVDAAENARMQRELEAERQRAEEAARIAKREAEARRLAEMKGKEEAESEARRLAQNESERLAQEEARKLAEEEAAKAAAELDRLRADRDRLQSEAQRLNELRAHDAADADAKLAAAQRALSESERQKNAEIARQAAVIASYSRTPSAVEKPARDLEAKKRTANRIVFPSDYKRSNHYSLPRLATSEEPAE